MEHNLFHGLSVETAKIIRCTFRQWPADCRDGHRYQVSGERAVGVHRAWSNFHSFKWSLLKYPLPDCPSSQVTVSGSEWSSVKQNIYGIADKRCTSRRGQKMSRHWRTRCHSVTGDHGWVSEEFREPQRGLEQSYFFLIITSSRTCTDSLCPSLSFMLSTPFFRIHLAVMAVPILHPSYVNLMKFYISWLISHNVSVTWSCSSCRCVIIRVELRHNICLRSA